MSLLMNPYEQDFKRAADPKQREQFWREKASQVSWFKPPTVILENSDPRFARWYPDGEINIIHNLLDRHLPAKAEHTALIWVSNMVQQERKYTFKQLHREICKMASLLIDMGVKKGDRVIIYMPMIPEAVFTAWACARIGAVHSIVFGGFAAKQLAGRIDNADPILVIAASCGIQPHKQVNYIDLLDDALKLAVKSPKILLYQRPSFRRNHPASWIEFDPEEMPFKDIPCTPMKSNDHLYILYTSGTTGAPKGIVRDHGGTTVALNWTMKHIMDIHENDVYFASSDIGWVVGHSFTVYGPLIRGATTILYEGKPTYPNPGALWQIIERHKVKGLYTSPTALRAIRKEDSEGIWVKKYNLSSLKGVSMAGQRCDISTYQWIESKLKVLINDNYWQTECGWIISCNYMNLHTFNPKPGSATKPCPGFIVEIINQNNDRVAQGDQGKVCVRLPMPPSFMLTLYNNDEAFCDKYMKETPGYYTTGDAGYIDADGYLNVMTRLDDIINTAGHRLSTAGMEGELMEHSAVAETAVVAKIEDLKGEIPVGFVVLKSGFEPSANITKQLIALIRKNIGPVAFFQHVIYVDKLPKTRSGKIIRYVLRSMLEGKPYKYPATIEDDSVLPIIEAKIKNYGHSFGEQKLFYISDLDHQNEFSLQGEILQKNDKRVKEQPK